MVWKRIFRISKWIIGIIITIILITSALLLVFKDDIKNQAINEINQYLNKKVHVGYFDVGFWTSFPTVSLTFEDILVYSQFKDIKTKDTAVYASEIVLHFNPIEFYNKNYNVTRIDIKNGNFHMKVLEDGSINYDFLKPSKDSVKTPFDFELEEINLSNVDFSYENQATEQFYAGYFNTLSLNGAFTEKQFVLDANTSFMVDAIRSKSITLIKNKKATCAIQIQMDQEHSIVEIKKADVSINSLPFFVQGTVSKDSINFYIGANDLSLVEVANNFSIQQLEMVNQLKGQGNVDFNLSIKGTTERTKAPRITADFQVQNGALKSSGFSLSQINLKGNYINYGEKGDKLRLSTVRFHSLNRDFKGNVLVTDFKQPHIVGQASGVVDLNAIHQLFGPFSLQKLTGSIDVQGNFDVRLNNPEFDLKDISLYQFSSSLKLNDVTFQPINDSRTITIHKGDVQFNKKKIDVKQLSVSLGKSDIKINGSASQIQEYLSNKGNLSFKGTIGSNFIAVSDFFKTSKTNSKQLRDWIFPTNLSGKLQLQLKKVEYSQHEYSKIRGTVYIREHQFLFPSIEGVNSNAKINGRLSLKETSPMRVVVDTELRSDQLNFRPLFKEWNNFQQEVIQSSNIKGEATVQLRFKGPFDLYSKKIMKEDFVAKASINIHNGALINVLPFKKITESLRNSAAKLVLSKRSIQQLEEELLHLTFNDFSNTFTLKDGVFTIPSMTIQSNALDVQLRGWHNFENEINYHFNFRLRELKSERKTQFGDVIDDESGVRVFLKMTGTIDNPQFSWDKNAHNQYKDERNEDAKEALKEALKTGFGFHKNDTSIKTIEPKKHREDKIIMDFDREKEKKEEQQKEKKEKNFLQQKISKWKEEKKKEEPDVQFEFGD